MLSVEEKKMLDVVLEVSGDDEKMIRKGLIKALKGQNDRARRTYLWNVLNRAAEERIHKARRHARNMR